LTPYTHTTAHRAGGTTQQGPPSSTLLQRLHGGHQLRAQHVACAAVRVLPLEVEQRGRRQACVREGAGASTTRSREEVQHRLARARLCARVVS
jgi:hypothetical protein